MNELHLFSGAGGGILGGILLGHTTVCVVEIEPYCRKILFQRQRDGILPKFPIWDDIRTFDGKPWRGIAEVICGGFPCQDISQAGKRKGITGEQSGLWTEMARVVCEVRPKYVFVENSPMLTIRGLGVVLRDLALMGYDARWCVLSAGDCGAIHERKRIWILANNKQFRCNGGNNTEREHGCYSERKAVKGFKGEWGFRPFFNPTHSNRKDDCNANGKPGFGWENWRILRENCGTCGKERDKTEWCKNRVKPKMGETDNSISYIEMVKSDICGMDDGLANHLDRLKAIGNGQVPIVAATAWRLLMEGIYETQG